MFLKSSYISGDIFANVWEKEGNLIGPHVFIKVFEGLDVDQVKISVGVVTSIETQIYVVFPA